MRKQTKSNNKTDFQTSICSTISYKYYFLKKKKANKWRQTNEVWASHDTCTHTHMIYLQSLCHLFTELKDNGWCGLSTKTGSKGPILSSWVYLASSDFKLTVMQITFFFFSPLSLFLSVCCAVCFYLYADFEFCGLLGHKWFLSNWLSFWKLH